MLGGNGGLPRFTVDNPKYHGSLGGHGGFKSPPLGFDGQLAKKLIHLFGHIFMQTHKLCFPWSLGSNFILTTIWAGVVTNGPLVNVTIN